jgi:uncharacterized membrane protein
MTITAVVFVALVIVMLGYLTVTLRQVTAVLRAINTSVSVSADTQRMLAQATQTQTVILETLTESLKPGDTSNGHLSQARTGKGR